MTDKKYAVHVGYRAEDGGETIEYQFATGAELDAFQQGLFALASNAEARVDYEIFAEPHVYRADGKPGIVSNRLRWLKL